MILLLTYWFFLFVFFLPAGVLLKNTFRIQTTSLPILLLLGMFLSAITFSITAFFFPLGWAVLTAHIAIFTMTGIIYKAEIRTHLSVFWQKIRSLTQFHKILLLLLTIGAALKSALLPSIVDNETYYVQTIKWVNEYGFVKGLANLHLFLGQTSGWHVLQAGLNFSFFTDRINDLNGFLFVVCTVYCFTEAQRHEKLHWISLMPLFSVIFFLFLDSPSPDLPLLMVMPIILHLYTEGNNAFRTAFTLFVFLVFVKVTIAPMALLFLFWPDAKKHTAFVFAIGIPALLIWVAKNVILTGYPLYPILSFETGVKWQLPIQVPAIIHEISNVAVYNSGSGIPFSARLWKWLMDVGVDGLMNKLAVVLFLIMPIFRKIRSDKRYLVIYGCFLVHFTILLFVSPQFRFFLPELLFFCAFIGNEALNAFKNRRDVYNTVMAAGCLTPLLLLFSHQSPMARISRTLAPDKGLEVSQLFIPEPNTRIPEMEFQKLTHDRLEYYSPKENFFVYGTGDGPLPCVNQKMLFMFAARTHYYPQLLGDDPGDGFHSVPLKEE